MLYPKQLLEVLSDADVTLDIIISNSAKDILPIELRDYGLFENLPPAKYHMHKPDALNAPISSGSVVVDGMVIVPCSMTTVGKIASGIGDNLICRAAGVMLKERRKLILVPRETPLSAVHLENMLRLSHAGAVILPACPGFYNNPQTVVEVVDTIVGRILDHLEIPHDLNVRWSGQ